MPDPRAVFRRARPEDVPAIVHLLADDPLGRTRERDEDPLPSSYREAFAAIDRDAPERARGLGRALFEWASRGRESAAATWCSSPPTRRGPTRGASTRASASWPPTRA